MIVIDYEGMHNDIEVVIAYIGGAEVNAACIKILKGVQGKLRLAMKRIQNEST